MQLKKIICWLVYFDISKAFYKVDHNILLNKLEKASVGEKFL